MVVYYILDMGRVTHVCATCPEHFTRRYSATRHNLTIHNGRGEIVPLLEYLVGRNSGRYRPSHPSWYRRRSKENRIHNFGHANASRSCRLYGRYFSTISERIEVLHNKDIIVNAYLQALHNAKKWDYFAETESLSLVPLAIEPLNEALIDANKRGIRLDLLPKLQKIT